MFKRKIFIYSFIILIIVGVFQYLGCKFNVYDTYSWYDIPMHFLGGLWVSLSVLTIYDYYLKNTSIPDYKKRIFKIVFFSLLFMTVSWEIFEFTTNITSLSDQGYWLDTFGDILNGFIGGTTGYFLYIKKILPNNK